MMESNDEIVSPFTTTTAQNLTEPSMSSSRLALSTMSSSSSLTPPSPTRALPTTEKSVDAFTPRIDELDDDDGGAGNWCGCRWWAGECSITNWFSF